MGVPALFRHLATKYPKITSPATPNSHTCDNLYLDMNGIIHPCSHPEDRPAPDSELDIYLAIFEYIDNILNIVRPAKLLYMAIDGVAPRAKMNQQRSRRFRAAQEAQILEQDKARILAQNNKTNEAIATKKSFDSNCITPGTPFMSRLAIALRYYISNRLNTDPNFKTIKIILSDATVPGEGEHKIMDFIRRQRNSPSYSVNTKHVMYGLDADLIMLAIATHEPHFEILREDVLIKDSSNRGCFICGNNDHVAADCKGKPLDPALKANLGPKPFVYLHIYVLREYLEMELAFNHPALEWDLERALDDWVFLCFFVGNDFLPHLPSLEIKEGAIEKLILLWKKHVIEQAGFITKNGEIDLVRASYILEDLGQVEDDIFRERRSGEERKRANQKRRKQERVIQESRLDNPQGYDKPDIGSDAANLNALQLLKQTIGLKRGIDKVIEEAAVEKPELLEEFEEIVEDEVSGTIQPNITLLDVGDEEEIIEDEMSGNVDPIISLDAPKIIEKLADSDEEPADSVRLWESGWKERYYSEKFNTYADDMEFKQNYVQGLCWVLKYYYQGVQSWTWYFPFHYSPFASDFALMRNLNITFNLGSPFNPYEQLLGVLPTLSKAHVPIAFQGLMSNENSEIIDFYPEKFPIDLNGKKYAWQGVALLPFIDETRLVAAMKPFYKDLTEAQLQECLVGNEYVFSGEDNEIYEPLCLIYGKNKGIELVDVDLFGSVSKDDNVCLPGSTLYNPFEEMKLDEIPNNASISAVYVMPSYHARFVFPARLLRGVRMPNKQLNAIDFDFVRSGGGSRGRGRGRGGYDSRGRVGEEEYKRRRYDYDSRDNSQSRGRSDEYRRNPNIRSNHPYDQAPQFEEFQQNYNTQQSYQQQSYQSEPQYFAPQRPQYRSPNQHYQQFQDSYYAPPQRPQYQDSYYAPLERPQYQESYLPNPYNAPGQYRPAQHVLENFKGPVQRTQQLPNYDLRQSYQDGGQYQQQNYQGGGQNQQQNYQGGGQYQQQNYQGGGQYQQQNYQGGGQYQQQNLLGRGSHPDTYRGQSVRPRGANSGGYVPSFKKT